jgi:NAD(P)-dependent dehydrogenase (short-subunit alcohol dehydrogenase family)
VKLEGNTFLITGGASGLGAGCVREFVGAGANVVIVDMNKDAGQQLASELGSRARFAATNVTDEASVQAAIHTAMTEFGNLRGAISCAGIIDAQRTVTKDGPASLERFIRVIQVNLIGTFNVMRLAAAAMAQAEPLGNDGERGVIINTASVAAYDGQMGQAAYSASKGGIVSMTLPVARELARYGIRVMAIAPGVFLTPMVDQLPEAVVQSLGAQVPFPSRLGQPAEFAALARHIVENPMLNGEVIRLDGAIRMSAK